MSKQKSALASDPTPNSSLAKNVSQGEVAADQSTIDATAHYKCLRNPGDGSMFYGEVAFVRKSTGQLAKRKSEIYETEIKAMTAEQRVEQFEMVRHGYGLQMFSGQRNEDGVITKYEGNWLRNKKHGEGFAVFADGSTYRGKFYRDVKEGQGHFTWAQGHEYKGNFRDGQMDGQGEFTHNNGSRHEGTFKRNLFQMEKCFVNPLDDEKQHLIVMARQKVIRDQKAAELIQRQREMEAAEATEDKTEEGNGQMDDTGQNSSNVEGQGFGPGPQHVQEGELDDMEGFNQGHQAF